MRLVRFRVVTHVTKRSGACCLQEKTMNIDWWKNPDKMSEQELRAEVKEWRTTHGHEKPIPHCEDHTGFAGWCDACHAMNPTSRQGSLALG